MPWRVRPRRLSGRCETDELNLISPSAGAMAFTAVQGAMPSSDHACYVLPDGKEMSMLMKIIQDGMDPDNRSGVRDLVTCEIRSLIN